MKCSSCQTDHPDGMKFCDECAIPLSGYIALRPGGVSSRIVHAPILGWFTEGFDTSDLVEARTLLEREAAEHVQA